METQLPSSDFWDVFAREYWHKKPAVFKGVLPKTLLSGKDVLEALGNFAMEASGQNPTPRGRRQGGFVRLFVEGRQIGPAEAWLIRPRGEDVTEYIREVGASFNGARVGVILNDVELFSQRAAEGIQALVAPLIARVGIPARKVESTIFAGDYAVTPFGIHKDDSADVLTLVIAGKKQMLVWPEEYFERHPERLQQLQRGNEAIPDFIDDAVVLDASPGDLMYWPGSAYHVAMNTGGAVVTCGIGFWHRAVLSKMVSEVVGELLAAKLDSGNSVLGSWRCDSGLPPELAASEALLSELLASGAFEDALARAWAERASRYGFTAHRKQQT